MENVVIKTTVLAGTLLTLTATAQIQYDFWISTNATGNMYPSGGTRAHPLDGSTRTKFDVNMANLPAQSTIHILPGTYQTWGGYVGGGGWFVKSGQKIIGSGIDKTVIQFPQLVPEWGAGAPIICSQVNVTNAEVSDLTCDGNWAAGSITSGTNTYPGDTLSGVCFTGTHNAVRRVKVKNLGYTYPISSEAWGITISGDGTDPSEDNIIEDCEVDPLIGGHNISALNFGNCSGTMHNNHIFLAADPAGSQIAINNSWGSNCLIEGNYVDGADVGGYSDTGTSTNINYENNTFKNVFQGFVFWNSPRVNLTFDFNKILLAPSGSYYSTAFGFPDGAYHTNITIIRNRVEFDGTPQKSAWFLVGSNIVNLTVADNMVDSSLSNCLSATNVKMYNNRGLDRKILPQLNTSLLDNSSNTNVTLVNP